jgi:LacI family transcriptional regulator
VSTARLHAMARIGRVTVREVAARAGVSVGTVSHVVSGRRRVAEATRERVESAIRTLDYRPNRLARSLLERRTHTIGMLIPDIANPFFGELARAVEREARATGYCVVFGNSENDPDEEARYLAEFVERRVDGMIVVTATAAPWIERLPADLAMVALDRYPAGWRYDAVLIDNGLGMELAVSHLAALGHRRLGFLGGDSQLTTGRERAIGFRAALARRGLRPAWRSSGRFDLESGRQQAAGMLRLEPGVRPTAIVGANDLIALGALLACRDAAVSVPDELSVVGFDDIPFSTLAFPPLTTVRQPIAELGALAAKLLSQRMRPQGKRRRAKKLVTVRPDLVIRGSTALIPEQGAR